MSIMAVGRAVANEIGGMGVGSMRPSLQHVVSAPPFSSSTCWPDRFDRKRHAQESIVFPDVCRFEAILDDLNCRKVARNQGIGMCRNSKRSDQSVEEGKGVLASSMLKARSQDQQTSWFDLCDSCRAAVWPPADVPASRLHAQTLPPSMGVHWNGHHGNSRKPVHPAPSDMRMLLFPTALAVAVGAIKDTKTAWFGRVAAENFISPARFPRYWRSGGNHQASFGPSWSQTVSETRCGQVGAPGPAPPVPGQSLDEFQGTKAL